MPDIYKQVGQFHNEGMDSVYKEVQKALISKAKSDRLNAKAQGSQRVKSSIDINMIINNATLKYCKSGRLSSEDYVTCSKIVNNTSKRFSAKGASLDSVLVKDNLSPIQKEYMDRIYSTIKSGFKNTDISKIKDKLDKINKNATSKLSNKDIQCIYIASSIAYASVQYWQNNFPKWYTLLKADEIAEKYKKQLSQKTRFKAKGLRITRNCRYW